jgi:hypothetical protein
MLQNKITPKTSPKSDNCPLFLQSLFFLAGVGTAVNLQAQTHIDPLQSAYQPSDYIVNISGDYEAADAPRRDVNVNLAVDGERVHLLWESTGPNYSGVRICYRGSSDGGRTWRQAVNLRENENSNALDLDPDFKCLAASDGYVHAVWLGIGWNVVYTRSADGGLTWEPVKALYPLGVDRPNSLVLQADGPNVVVACSVDGATFLGTGDENGNAVDTFVSSDYGTTFARSNVEFSPEGSFKMNDMALHDEEIHVMFSRSNQRLYLKSSRDLGQTWGDLHLINTPVTDSEDIIRRVTRAQDYHYTPKLAVTDDYFYALWFNVDTTGDCAGYSLRLARSDDAGLTFATPEGGITLASYPNDTCATAFTGQETIAAAGENAYILRKDRYDKNVYLHVVPVGGDISSHPLTDRGWGALPVLALDDKKGRVHFFPGWNLHCDLPLGESDPSLVRGFVNYGIQDMNRLDRPQMIVTDGVVYWAGDGNLSYWADYGPTWPDIWFRRQAIEPMEALPLPTGKKHYLSLNDDSEDGVVFDNVQLRSQPSLALEDRFTIALWIHSRSETSFPILSRERYSGENAIQFECKVGSWDKLLHAQVRVVTSGMSDRYYGTVLEGGLFESGTWHHMALTYDASLGADNLVYYFDGELMDTANASGVLDVDNLMWWLGNYGRLNNRQATFDVDNLAFYSEALSAAEIAALLESAPVATDPRLLAFYPFNGGSLRDATGNGNDGIPMFHATFNEGTLPYESDNEGYLPGSEMLGGSWETHPTFGIYNSFYWPWILHADLGYLFIHEPGANIDWGNVYFFSMGLQSWIYTAVTNPSFSYPLAYAFAFGTWGDFRMDNGVWGFYRYDNGSFVSLW